MGDKVRGSGVSPRGVPSLDCVRKRGSGLYRFSGFRGGSGGGAAHFVILSGEKRRMLKIAYLKI